MLTWAAFTIHGKGSQRLDWSTFLLDSVREFVGQQPCAALCRRRISASSKHHIVPYGISQRVHCFCGLRCSSICVYSDMAEVLTKPGLKERACADVQRLSGRAQ